MLAAETASLRREVLHQAIQDRIKRFIIERGYQPGDPLPGEAELAKTLGISRPSLREAMKALQTFGVVETRHGAGTFVGRFSLVPLVDGLAFSIRSDMTRNVQTIRELVEIREVLERDLVARVARIVSPDQLAALRTLVATMEERANQDEDFPEEDRLFHEVLYQPLGNALVVQLLQAFWDVFYAVRNEMPGAPMNKETVGYHRRIVEALEAGDSEVASAAMIGHFAGIHERLNTPKEREGAL